MVTIDFIVFGHYTGSMPQHPNPIAALAAQTAHPTTTISMPTESIRTGAIRALARVAYEYRMYGAIEPLPRDFATVVFRYDVDLRFDRLAATVALAHALKCEANHLQAQSGDQRAVARYGLMEERIGTAFGWVKALQSALGDVPIKQDTSVQFEEVAQ